MSTRKSTLDESFVDLPKRLMGQVRSGRELVEVKIRGITLSFKFAKHRIELLQVQLYV